ncbi:MAG: TetR/AcrR family transcriptional regulator [Armatimonas sp.]
MKKTSLTHEQIVTVALAQIEESGLERFSTRKLGAALGIEAMSLYHYFPSKGHLLDAVADRILTEVTVPDTPANDPVERFRQTCLHYRKVARTYPQSFLLIAARRYNTPGALALLESILALLQEAGLSPERAARRFRLMGYFLNGALLSELTISGQRPDSTGSAVDAGGPAELYAVAKSAPFLGAAYLEEAFQEGLELLLAQLAEELAASSPAT